MAKKPAPPVVKAKRGPGRPPKALQRLEPPTEKPYKEIGRLIRDLRISAGMTQFDLADAVGVNNSYLSRIENGERRPSTKVMRKMSETLNYPYDELVVASGLLSAEFREKKALGNTDVTVLKDIHDIKAVLARFLSSSDWRSSMSPSAERYTRRGVPVFDTIPAGYFDDANVVEVHDDIEQLVLTEDELAYDPKAFALIVKGDSMVEAGILDGDLIIVSPNTRVVDGDIAVVQLNGRETTVKIVFFEDDSLLLQPANSAYRPMTLRYPDQVEILGKVVLVRRKLIV